MAIIEIKVPSPGESITEVVISRWIKKDGEFVEKDEEMAEIESDKATLTVNAEESGALKILVAEGETVKVGQVVCSIDTSVKGEKKVEAVRIKNNQKGEKQELAVSAYFAAIGHNPNSGIFKGWLDMDDTGYIKTFPGTSKTSVEGVFAAGDVQDKIYRQAVTAAGSGCMAALDAERYLSHISSGYIHNGDEAFEMAGINVASNYSPSTAYNRRPLP